MVESPENIHDEPFFSIIIPCYNVEPFVQEALDSILVQDFEDFEIICVDDGSTDRTLAVLEQCSALDPRVKIIASTNGGVSAARNKGLRDATGQFILFVDGDDTIKPGLLSRIFGAYSRNTRVDLIGFGYDRIDEKGDILPGRALVNAPNLKRILRLEMSPSVWGKAIRRTLIVDNAILFDENLVAEDLEYSFRIGLHAASSETIEERLYCWRITHGSQSRQITNLYITSYFVTFRRVRSELEETGKYAPYLDDYRFFVLALYSNLLKKLAFADRGDRIHFIQCIYQEACSCDELTDAFKHAPDSARHLVKEILASPGEMLFRERRPRRLGRTLDPILPYHSNTRVAARWLVDSMLRIPVARSVSAAKKCPRKLADIVLPRGSARREAFKRLLRGSRAAESVGQPAGESTSAPAVLCTIPVVSSQSDFEDLMLRLNWYVVHALGRLEKIVVPMTSNYSLPSTAPGYMSTELLPLSAQLVEKIEQRVIGESDRSCSFSNIDADVYLYLGVEESLEAIRETFPADKRLEDVSRHTQGGPSNFLWFGSRLTDTMATNREAYLSRLDSLKSRGRRRRGYIFGTGPGIDQLTDYDFSDGDSIVCNSLIGNQEFLEKTRPFLTVAGDPIFHAGCSSYAQKYREDLARFLLEGEKYVVVPERDIHIYDHHLNDELRARLIAIGFDSRSTDIRYSLTESLAVSTTSNILTLYLLPLAAYFFDDIVIAGCDGRPLRDNEYYWSHSKASQYNDKMQDIQQAHPGFFSVDYDAYYLKHCFILDKWIRRLEDDGKTVTNLTPSYIPALYARTSSDISRPPEEEVQALKSAVDIMSSKYDWDNDIGICRPEHKYTPTMSNQLE